MDDPSAVLIDITGISPGVSIDFTLTGQFAGLTDARTQAASIELYAFEFEPI